MPPADRTLPLAYDAADPQARILAERIAVNARDAGITLQVTNQPRSELRLARARFSSLDAAVGRWRRCRRRWAWANHACRRRAASRALLHGRARPAGRLSRRAAVPFAGCLRRGARVKVWHGRASAGWVALNLADIWLETAP